MVRNKVGGPAFVNGLFRGTVPSDAGEGAREEDEDDDDDDDDEDEDEDEEPRW